MCVNCWPEGTSGKPCEATIPNTNYETMKRYGWGFTLAPDAGSSTGDGAFYACPEHRDDVKDDVHREDARRRYRATPEGQKYYAE